MKRITKIEGNAALLDAVRKIRVAAYCRVSTGSDEQLLSLETQKDHYERYIKAHPDWESAGSYHRPFLLRDDQRQGRQRHCKSKPYDHPETC